MWALLALVIAQVAITQHNATHIEHGFEAYDSVSHSSDTDHQDQENQKHKCPEFLLTKSLQTAFYNSPVIISVPVVSYQATASQEFHIVVKVTYSAHSPRAPPAFLI